LEHLVCDDHLIVDLILSGIGNSVDLLSRHSIASAICRGSQLCGHSRALFTLRDTESVEAICERSHFNNPFNSINLAKQLIL
jgi:hypothetical protein